jgi:hypothetical protein
MLVCKNASKMVIQYNWCPITEISGKSLSDYRRETFNFGLPTYLKKNIGFLGLKRLHIFNILKEMNFIQSNPYYLNA